MPHCYFLAAGLLLAALSARAQCSIMGPPTPTNLQVTNLTATTATLTFNGGAGVSTCPTQISYTYAGGSAVSVPYALPLLLTGLPPSTAITLTVVRYFPNGSMNIGPRCCPLATNSLTFSTAAGPLAAQPAAEAGALTLAPNPAQGRATLTLTLPAPAVAQVLDALGREVRRQALPARATTAVLDLAGLPPGLYLVRAGSGTTRLVLK